MHITGIKLTGKKGFVLAMLSKVKLWEIKLQKKKKRHLVFYKHACHGQTFSYEFTIKLKYLELKLSIWLHVLFVGGSCFSSSSVELVGKVRMCEAWRPLSVGIRGRLLSLHQFNQWLSIFLVTRVGQVDPLCKHAFLYPLTRGFCAQIYPQSHVHKDLYSWWEQIWG